MAGIITMIRNFKNREHRVSDRPVGRLQRQQPYRERDRIGGEQHHRRGRGKESEPARDGGEFHINLLPEAGATGRPTLRHMRVIHHAELTGQGHAILCAARQRVHHSVGEHDTAARVANRDEFTRHPRCGPYAAANLMTTIGIAAGQGA